MFNKKPKCHEVAYIINYVQAYLKGEKPEKPILEYDIHKYIFELFSRLLEMGALNNEFILKLINEAASLSDFDVNMSFISKELKKVAEQLAEASESNMAVVEETTANASEVSEVIIHNTEILNDLVEKSEDLIKNNTESKNQLHQINQIKETVIINAENMSEKIRALEEISLKVDEIVSGVSMIADQTNLLALNASIEAARAGEHGRGFSVVADQIRKLAEDTKIKLNSMQSFTNDMRNATSEGSESVSSTINSMTDMTEKIGTVNISFNESTDKLENIVRGITSLANSMEDITASSEEISSAMNIVANESEKISQMTRAVSGDSEKAHYYARSLGKIDDTISGIIRELVKILNSGTHPVSNEEFLEILEDAIQAHKSWMDNLKQIVNDKQLRPIQKDGNKCRFGHFYNSLNITHLGIREEWVRINEDHLLLHNKAHEIFDAMEQGNNESIQKILAEAEQLSNNVVSILSNISKEVKNIDGKVFQLNL
ncbi:methyl-accepting chemotaxis protein [Clostridium thailandense]|uniref:Chemotaxis protein n=1 Tax=Clostridium thailandense TaxID=2794346 RepID=A0A949WRE7_9CLOT|nr:methyl-accepting chemotaxis protein [Clostridium thailandense]MBV7273935.1 chemotaxis protein [Clostridium thailandense]MCH5137217.1 chemotaxis protein [Clostridiaceae bacterium UIB06]